MLQDENVTQACCRSIVEAFEKAAQQYANNPAVITSTEQIDYRTLERRTGSLARWLRARFTRPVRIVVVGRSSLEALTAILGVLRSASIVIPVDVDSGLAYLETICRDADPDLVIYSNPSPEQYSREGRINHTEFVQIIEQEECTVFGSSERGPLPEHAYIYFTSGTTSKPKGVIGLHSSLAHFVNWQATEFQVGPSDRFSHLTSIGFDVYLREVFTPLISGATLVIPDQCDRDAANTLMWLDLANITVLHSVPSLLGLWMTCCASEGVTLKGLRSIFCAGEPLPGALARRYRDRFSLHGIWVNLYGPTETTLAKFFFRLPDEPGEGVMPVGHPLPDTQALIIGNGESEVSRGSVGEIVIETCHGSAGYLDAALSAPFRFGDAPGMVRYATGDLGYINGEGLLVVLGRKDRQVKINGVRIEPEGVAAQLAECPGVEAVTVVARTDDHGRYFLTAYWTRSAGWANVESAGLRAFAEASLSRFHQPSVYIELDRFPVTDRGKIDHRRLPVSDRSEKLSLLGDEALNALTSVPRLAGGAIRHLEELFAGNPHRRLRVLEFGMGGSTLWFAERTVALTSVEHNTDWFERIRVRLKDHPARLLLRPLPLADVCDQFVGDIYDIILIDNEDFDNGRMRYECFRRSLPLLAPGGTILFDNADRPEFAPVFELMADRPWQMNISTNHYAKPGYNEGSQTAWWIKPGADRATDIVPKPHSFDPDTPLAEQWRAVWQEVLGRPVRLADRLSELGADSIQIQLILYHGSKIPHDPSAFLRDPSPEQLAATRLETVNDSDDFLHGSKTFPLLPTQLDILALDNHFNFISPPKAWFVSRDLPVTGLQRAWREVVSQFPALRMQLDRSGPYPLQQIAPFDDSVPAIREHSIAGASIEACHQGLAQFVEAQKFDDICGSFLYKVYLISAEVYEDRILLIIAQHLLMDGYSWTRIDQALNAFVSAVGLDQPFPVVPSRTQQLIDYAYRLKELSEHREWRERSICYWRNLPRYPRVERFSEKGYHYCTKIFAPPEWAALMQKLEGTGSPAEVLGALVTQAVGLLTGTDRMCAEWVTGGRDDGIVDAMDSCGCLYRTFPVAVSLRPGASPRDLVKAIRHEVSDAQSLFYSCRRWLADLPEDRPVWKTIDPLFTFNFQVEGSASELGSDLLVAIDRPVYRWKVDQTTLSEQISVPLRFFFYVRDNQLHGYVLSQKALWSEHETINLLEQIFRTFSEIGDLLGRDA